MKNFFLLLLVLFGWNTSTAQNPGEWIWIHGTNINGSPGNFGVQGVPSATNDPPCLYEACEWTDLNGNFWLYGGWGAGLGNPLADLWKYDPITNLWVWIKGPGINGIAPVYGVKGVPALTNTPGARAYGITSWVDLQGNFWLFGGSQQGGSNFL